MKKTAALLCAAMIFLLCFTGCKNEKSAPESERLSIVATMFPQYDFCREICAGTADITLLLPPGVESHSYDPTPADILKIVNCDVFIYTGPEMETWAQSILAGVGSDVTVIDLSQCVELIADCHDDDCEDEHDEDHDHEHEHHGHHHTYDPHIWTSPKNAESMTRRITETLCVLSPENSNLYLENCESYCGKLDGLDSEFMNISENAVSRTIVFGGKFSFGYFTEQYGFDWTAAYDSCSHESEPSVGKVAELIDYVRENNVSAVYYEELTNPTVARTIAREGGAEIRLLHSCHNVSKDELDSGVTYLSIMENNVKNLREGLC